MIHFFSHNDLNANKFCSAFFWQKLWKNNVVLLKKKAWNIYFLNIKNNKTVISRNIQRFILVIVWSEWKFLKMLKHTTARKTSLRWQWYENYQEYLVESKSSNINKQCHRWTLRDKMRYKTRVCSVTRPHTVETSWEAFKVWAVWKQGAVHQWPKIWKMQSCWQKKWKEFAGTVNEIIKNNNKKGWMILLLIW